MNILAMADLHLEFDLDFGHAFLEAQPLDNIDVIVIAGDLGNADSGPVSAAQLATLGIPVLYVPGNHDYYYGSFPSVDAAYQKLDEKLRDFHYLQNKKVVIDGVSFLGTCLWFRNRPQNNKYIRGMMDIELIKNFSREVYNQNSTAVAFLKENVTEGSVVVTHHAPSFASVHPRYAHSALNRFFVCPLEDFIKEKKPQLWVHGHMHDRCDHTIGATRIFCNPRAYPREVASRKIFDRKTPISLVKSP